jgi:hypothetical protein
MLESLICAKSKSRLHDWGKWEPHYKADLKTGEKVIGRLYVQQRTCNGCGFSQRHTQEIRGQEIAE